MDVRNAPLIEVTWADAAIDLDHQGTPEEASTFGGKVIRKDVGYLVRVTPEENELVLAVGICVEDNQFMHSNTITLSMVIGEPVILTRSQECLPMPTAPRKRSRTRGSKRTSEPSSASTSRRSSAAFPTATTSSPSSSTSPSKD